MSNFSVDFMRCTVLRLHLKVLLPTLEVLWAFGMGCRLQAIAVKNQDQCLTKKISWLFLLCILFDFKASCLAKSAKQLAGNHLDDDAYVFSLWAFGALCYAELYILAFIKRLVAAWVLDLLKITKTSGPDFCSIKPKPLSELNHLTVPVVIVDMMTPKKY